MNKPSRYTLSRLSKDLGLSYERIRQLRAAGMPVHSREAAQAWRVEHQNLAARKPLPATLPPSDETGITPDLQKLAPPSTAVAEGYSAARARREVADAEISEIQLKKLRGDLLTTADVARAGFEIGRDIRDAMESSVNSLAAELAPLLTAEACGDILRRHNRALQELLSKGFREKIGQLPAVPL